MSTTNVALRPSYWASVSGGKDSLKMLMVILNNLDKYPLSGVVHFELEIDYPFIKDVVDKMEKMCKKIGVPFVRIKPRKSWYELYNKRGFPSQKTRWCNKEYKLDAKRQLKAFLKAQGWDLIEYIGYCADEVKRYSKRDTNRERYPLVEEGINESEILEWARNIPLFNDYYKYNKRCGCMFCPMASRRELAYLLMFYPQKYEEMMRMASETESEKTVKLGKPMSVWSGKPKYNTAYVDKTVREIYLPQLEAEMAQEVMYD